jgi:hypothetical protein
MSQATAEATPTLQLVSWNEKVPPQSGSGGGGAGGCALLSSATLSRLKLVAGDLALVRPARGGGTLAAAVRSPTTTVGVEEKGEKPKRKNKKNPKEKKVDEEKGGKTAERGKERKESETAEKQEEAEKEAAAGAAEVKEAAVVVVRPGPIRAGGTSVRH